MRLDRFLDGKPRGEIARLAKLAELSWQLVHAAARELKPIKTYEAARKLSDATGGAVSVEELARPHLFNADGSRKPEATEGAA